MSVTVIGAGPAGLMAASRFQAAGYRVQVYDAMPSAGRKFLLAGIGGLNLTHAEPFEQFVTRYRSSQGTTGRHLDDSAQARVTEWLRAFGPQDVRDWAKGLGIDTFVGTSQRVFPTEMKAAPLLRAWLHRLRHPVQTSASPAPSSSDASTLHGLLHPVQFHMRHRWLGWAEPPTAQGHTLHFAVAGANAAAHSELPTAKATGHPPEDMTGERLIHTPRVVLALGGASWPQLGSDAAWVPWLQALGIRVNPLRPANCGFDAAWSDHFNHRLADPATGLAGSPLKHVRLTHTAPDGTVFSREGECVLTQTGLEGSVVYAASAPLRDAIAAKGHTTLHLDLLPKLSAEQIAQRLAKPRGKQSLSNHLRRVLALDVAKLALLRECTDATVMNDVGRLAAAIKSLPVTLTAPRPVAEAISTAGGVALDEVDATGLSRRVPGLWMVGEMLDWEAPTGGYLLTACFSSGWSTARPLSS